MKLAPPTPCSRSAGSALTIVLITVAMVVLLVVLALSIASIDRRNSANALGREAAQALGEVALDEVASKIASIPLDRHWAAAPGRLRIWNGSDWDQVDLHSGDGSGNTNPDESVDLNARLSDGTYLILPPNQEFPTAPEMRVRWIYVSENGSTSTTPPASGVIGRYAYWADIENGRVNINTAGLGMTEFDMPDLQSWVTGLAGLTAVNLPSGAAFVGPYRDEVWAKNPWVSDRVGIDTNTGRPTFPPPATGDGVTLSLNEARQNTPQYLTAHPSSINLSYLDGVSADEGFNTFRYAGSYFLRADALTSMLRGGEARDGIAPFYWDPGLADDVDLSVRFFDAPEDWQRIVDADTFEANKGYITVRGRTPEITPWGTPKLALSFPSRANADQRNDLTETYVRRNVRLFTNIPNTTTPGGYTAVNVYENTQDTRMVQMPALNPSWDTFDTANPGRNHRLMIRDLTAGFYNNTTRFARATPNRLSVLWAIKQHLAGVLPGLPGSLAQKYDASSPGEADQVTVEMATFLDNQLAPQHPGRTRTMLLFNQTPDTVLDPPFPDPGDARFSDVTKKHYSGRRLPYVPANSTAPPIRRLGTYGGPLLNEVVARAFSVPMTIVPAAPTGPPNTQVARIINQTVNTLTGLANGTLSPPLERISQWGGQNAFVFVLRNPAWIVPPPSPPDNVSPLGTTNDRFIRIEFRAEMFLPALWSLRSRVPAYSNYFTFGVHLTDVVCEVNGVSYRVDQTSLSDPTNRNDGKASWIGSMTSIMGPGDYAGVNMRSPNAIIIGPFNPAGQVDLNVKIRLIVNHFDGGLNAAGSPTGNNSPTYAAVLPGIFPDFQGDGTPADGVDGLFEFSFPNFQMGGLIEQSSGVTVSLEARDPRVTRRPGDWVTRATDTLSAPNAVYNPGATADFYRPDPLLQHVRGMLRGRISSSNNDHHLETQTASRILGLPGVGYLSSIPTGVNSGIPWQTMKFHDSNEPVPDWLLWSLFYVPYDRSICDQTDGKLNINATLWPWGIERARPLEALLGDRVTDPESLSRSIASAAGSGKSIGPDDMFVYPGQICQVPGVAPNTGDETNDREALVRDLADIITTQCDDYRVFVIAQPLRQAPNGTFTPIATARLEATISRSPDEDGSGFFLGPESQGDLQVFTRASYQANGARGTRINVKGNGTGGNWGNPTRPNGWSNLGLDGRPNTADDWLIPQKVEISALRFLP